MVILGIDPGYAIVGWGVLDYRDSRFAIKGYGSITTPAGMDFPQRLRMIYQDMNTILQRYHPDVLSIEKLYFTNNKTTGIDVAQARGVILLACAQSGMQVSEYTPMQVKQSVVGYGKAEKKAGDGDDPHPAAPACGAQAGRYGRRAGAGHLPRPLRGQRVERSPAV